MFNEYDNVRNPMLGAYLLWNFVLGYFSEKNEATPIEELFMVGKKMSIKLKALNINSIGDLANTPLNTLKIHFKNI